MFKATSSSQEAFIYIMAEISIKEVKMKLIMKDEGVEAGLDIKGFEDALTEIKKFANTHKSKFVTFCLTGKADIDYEVKDIDGFFDDFKKVNDELQDQAKLIKELKFSKTMLARGYAVKLGVLLTKKQWIKKQKKPSSCRKSKNGKKET